MADALGLSLKQFRLKLASLDVGLCIQNCMFFNAYRVGKGFWGDQVNMVLTRNVATVVIERNKFHIGDVLKPGKHIL